MSQTSLISNDSSHPLSTTRIIRLACVKSSLSLVNIFIMKITFPTKCANARYIGENANFALNVFFFYQSCFLYINCNKVRFISFPRLCRLVLRYIYNNFIFLFSSRNVKRLAEDRARLRLIRIESTPRIAFPKEVVTIFRRAFEYWRKQLGLGKLRCHAATVSVH